MAKRSRGRPRKIKVTQKARTKIFGRGARGARTPAQVKAALMRDIKRGAKRKI